MGIFGSLIGWDQSMGALNAVLANHLLENCGEQQRKRIAAEVAKIIASVKKGDIRTNLQRLSNDSRIVQMNFVALACDNLGISPTIPNNVWTRVKSPYVIGTQVDDYRIESAITAIKKQDGVVVNWPGAASKINFLRMLDAGCIDDVQAVQEVKRPQLVIREIDRRGQSTDHPQPVIQPEPVPTKPAPPAFNSAPKTVLSADDRQIIADLKLAGWTVMFNGKSWTFRNGDTVRELFDAEELRIFANKSRK